MSVNRKNQTHNKAILLFLLITVIFLLRLLFYVQFRLNDFETIPNLIILNARKKNSNTTKTILFWNTLFGAKHFYFGNGDLFAECPVNDCYATDAKGLQKISKFDAILFHGNELEAENLPGKREARQWYVYVNLESPENRVLPPYFDRDYFNLTMTYRLDSDIVWSYGVVKDIKTNETVAPFANTTWQTFVRNSKDNDLSKAEERRLSEIILAKEKAVSWFVSNCQAKSGRLAYVEELSKYIEVDVYGECGTYRCSRSSDCIQQLIEPRYFFYLSFENSLCQDYVTEKLYHTLRYYVIPIVYGGGNYSMFAPPKSYINALDFDSPMDLANYLHFLMHNPAEYRKYFAWKRYYKVEGGTENAKCQLCALLHKKSAPKSYGFLSDWYAKDACPIQKILSSDKYATRELFSNITG